MKDLTYQAAFAEALKGCKIARACWPAGMWVIRFSQSNFITLDIPEGEPSPQDLAAVNYEAHIGEAGTRIEHIGITDTGAEFYPMRDFYLLKTPDNTVGPYAAAYDEYHAKDWFVVT